MANENKAKDGDATPHGQDSTATVTVAPSTTSQKSTSNLATKNLTKARGPTPAPTAPSIAKQNGATQSRMFRLFNHVPPKRTLRTVLAEMESELRKTFPAVSKKLNNRGQDVHALTDLHSDDEDAPHAHALEDYNEIIEKAKEAIAMNAQEKIQNGDTILIYGYSKVIKDTLLLAIEKEKKFSLIIVENSLGYRSGAGHDMTQNGQEIHALHIMHYLAPKIKNGAVSVTHVHLSGLSFVLRTVTKLMLTAYALLTNGGVLGRIGTAQIALMAHKKNIPVVVCCETFKFCDESPVDAFFQNQRGFLRTRQKKDGLKTQEEKPKPWQSQLSTGSTRITQIEENSYLKAPVLKYDITPAQFVTAVVTEVDIFPATSIALLLSVQENRNKSKKDKNHGHQTEIPAAAAPGSSDVDTDIDSTPVTQEYHPLTQPQEVP